jgi:NADH-quinone oxidoreductase subunit C
LTPDPADLTEPTAADAHLIGKLRERLSNAYRADRCFRGQLSVWIEKHAVPDALRFLRAEPDLLYEYLTDLTAVDRLSERAPGEPRFEVVYILYSPTFNRRLLLKTWVDDGESVPSATAVWPGANFMEREVYDLFGILFAGHPNLERILTPDGWLGHPLRKDFPTQSDQFPNVER